MFVQISKYLHIQRKITKLWWTAMSLLKPCRLIVILKMSNICTLNIEIFAHQILRYLHFKYLHIKYWDICTSNIQIFAHSGTNSKASSISPRSCRLIFPLNCRKPFENERSIVSEESYKSFTIRKENRNWLKEKDLRKPSKKKDF